MAENLNYAAEGSKCHGGEQANCNAHYGRLYDWATAMSLPSQLNCNFVHCSGSIQSRHRGVCPAGWHLPSDMEWDILINHVGGAAIAGTKLKSKKGWNTGSGYIPGSDDYGFSALPYGSSYDDDFGIWWSTTEFSSNYVYYRGMDYNYSMVYRNNAIYEWTPTKSEMLSVRCIEG